MPIEEFPDNDYERYEAEKARLHRLHERLARREEMADIESEEERIKERWKNFQTMIMNGMKLRKQGFIDCMSD